MTKNTKIILPGSTIGVVGGGQLGRMLVMAAKRLGYNTHVFTPDENSPAAQVSDITTCAAFDDLSAVKKFAQKIAVAAFEFENIPAATLNVIEKYAPVRPSPEVLHTTQERLREKRFLARHGFPVAPFREITSEDTLTKAFYDMGGPCVLKTAGFGYDGKGQSKILNANDIAPAFAMLKGQTGVLEKFVTFTKEISVVGARDVHGAFASYGAIENRHKNHILDVSIAPALVTPRVAKNAAELARAILSKLQVIGVLCVEFFVLSDGALVVNELAPRPHNSGHLTIEASVTSQFEQQLRAVCGLPLGDTRLRAPAAMANLLGDAWQNGEPNWSALLAHKDVSLHLYGKSKPAAGRKMGHITVVASTQKRAIAQLLKARKAL